MKTTFAGITIRKPIAERETDRFSTEAMPTYAIGCASASAEANLKVV